METVLVATDGSEYAETATDVALDRAAARGAKLHVICVVDSRRVEEPALGSAELTTVYAEDHARECVSDVRERAADRGLSVESTVRRGIPHEVILDYADEVDADIIVVGAHGDHGEHFSGVGQEVRESSEQKVVVVSE